MRVLPIAILAGLALAAPPAAAESGTELASILKVPDAAQLRQWRQLAEAGNAEAQYRLGEAYRYGRGVAENDRIAEEWLARAAGQGHALAQADYGLLLFGSGRQHEAMRHVAAAAERGDARAQYVYGTALFNGDYVAKDWVRAYVMMHRAARAGLDAAATSLAQMNRYIPLGVRREGLALAEAAPEPRPAPAPKPVRTATRPSRPKAAQLAAAAPRAVADVPPPVAARPIAPVPSPGGDWQVQLGAFGDAAKARTLWAKLAAEVPAFAGLEPRYVPAGPLTRLRAAGLATRADAERLCAEAKAKGQACFPVNP